MKNNDKRKWLEINFENKIGFSIYSEVEDKLFIDLLASQNKNYKNKVGKYMNQLSDISEYISLDWSLNKTILTDDKKADFNNIINNDLLVFIKDVNNDKYFNLIDKDEIAYFQNKFDKSKEYEEKSNNSKFINLDNDIYYDKSLLDRYIIPVLFLANLEEKTKLEEEKTYVLKAFYFDKSKINERNWDIKKILENFILANDSFTTKSLFDRVSYTSNYKLFDKDDFDECILGKSDKEKIKILNESYESYLEKYFNDDSSHKLKTIEENIRTTFTNKFTKGNIKNISLDDYCIWKQNKNSYSYLLERDDNLIKFWSIRWWTSAKFGVYYSEDDSKYKFTKDYKDENDAIEKIREDLYNIANCKSFEDLSKLDNNLSLWLKNKTFDLYTPWKIIPIYTKDKMEQIFNNIWLKFIDYNKAQTDLFNIYNGFKLVNKSPLSFMYFLADPFNQNNSVENILDTNIDEEKEDNNK